MLLFIKVMKMNMETASFEAEVVEGADDLSSAMLQHYMKSPQDMANATRSESIVNVQPRLTGLRNRMTNQLSADDDETSDTDGNNNDSDKEEREAARPTHESIRSSLLPLHIQLLGKKSVFKNNNNNKHDSINEDGTSSDDDSDDGLRTLSLDNDRKNKELDELLPGQIVNALLQKSGVAAYTAFESWDYDSSLFKEHELCHQFGCVACEVEGYCFCTAT